jgi:predicted DNA-binding transcriptional regulator AlpA
MDTTPMETQPLLLTVNEVAKLLSCSPRHVYRLCDGGLMPKPEYETDVEAVLYWGSSRLPD